MTTQTVRTGFVGAANNTRRRHIPGFQALSGVELVMEFTEAVARSSASGHTVPVADL